MTDKERLEEFREFIDFMYESIDIEDHQRFVAISDSLLKDGWFKWIYRFAKEQAEKNMTCQEVLDLQKDALKGLLEQNKRYREVIESMKSEIKYALYSNKSEDVKRHYLENAKREADEALEEESK